MEEVTVGGEMSEGENVLGELFGEGNCWGGCLRGGGNNLLPNYYISCPSQFLAMSTMFITFL